MKNFNALAQGTGKSITSEESRKIAAWTKAFPILGRNPAVERRDCDGREIHRLEYGKLTVYGWEIDHIVQTAFGGNDLDYNLRARHWRGNRQDGAFIGNALSSVNRLLR